MPRGGELSISIKRVQVGDNVASSHGCVKPGSYALLSVTDSGAGMDPATLEKRFEPFFTTKEVGKGTGLGLAVVYGIIKQHDGYLKVSSEQGSGTSFRIYLPIVSAESPREEVAHTEEPPRRGTETILFAEDDESVREPIRSILELERYTVIVAVNGKDAVEKFMESKDEISLLLFDLIMPDKNGKEAYDEIKAIRPEVKAIIASGYAPEFIREKILLDSGIELMHKPILPHLLLKRVRAQLDAP